MITIRERPLHVALLVMNVTGVVCTGVWLVGWFLFFKSLKYHAPIPLKTVQLDEKIYSVKFSEILNNIYYGSSRASNIVDEFGNLVQCVEYIN